MRPRYDHDSVEALFHAALKRAPHERMRFVFDSCYGRYKRFRDVVSLLEWHDQAGGVLDAGVASSAAVMVDDADLTGQVSTSVGQYRVLRQLGNGGMGRVYLAEQVSPIRRRVALKVIRHAVDARRAATRFETERQVLSLMNHPGIAAVYEVGTLDDGRLFFAMEYVEGFPIDVFCRQHSIAIRERLRLFVDICAAVEHAHRRGVVHRDLKMSNILVTAADGRPVTKVIDFGVSKITHQRAIEQTLQTMHGAIVGSVSYMSPEQADCRILDVDTRSDVYSLGVVLCELLTGRNPLGLDSENLPHFDEVARRIRDSSPVRPSALLNASDALGGDRVLVSTSTRRLLRNDLDWIVLRALEKERARRYQTVSELCADIMRVLNHEPVAAGPPSLSYRARKFVRRNRILVSFTTVVVLALLAGMITSATLSARHDRLKNLAQLQRDELLDLTMIKEIALCVGNADSLRAPDPATIGDMQATLSEARRLVRRLPDFASRLASLQLLADRRRVDVSEASGAAAEVVYHEFNDPELQFQYDIVVRVVEGLDRLNAADPRRGVITGLVRRIGVATTLRTDSIDRYRELWDEAVAAIGDTLRCPGYRGLEIAPQLGLVPIGVDATSGLYEFHVLHSGQLAQRRDDGRLAIDGSTGVILVLIPGGCFYMGTSREPSSDPRIPWNANARPSETPPHRVCLDPFFISKYEMTQGQWSFVNQYNPSVVDWKFVGLNYPLSAQHPVENITWYDADRVARSFGLELPTEAQWEYAARAGTTTPWGSGETPDALRWYANMKDQSYNEFLDWNARDAHEWSDGFAGTAPVGEFLANGFGLHDTMGNVWEWTRGPAGEYTDPVRNGDGLRLSDSPLRAVRGPGMGFSYPHGRITWRLRFTTDYRVAIGVRPARRLDGMRGQRGQAAH